jgi:hypothetical protein
MPVECIAMGGIVACCPITSTAVSEIRLQNYFACALPFFRFDGCAPCRGMSAVGFTLRRRESASFSGSGMRILFPGFGIFIF